MNKNYQLTNVLASPLEPKGIVTIKVRDANTNELKRTHTSTNIMTTTGAQSLFYECQYRGTTYNNTGCCGYWEGAYVQICDNWTNEPLYTLMSAFPNKVPGQRIMDWTFYEGAPDYIESETRFAQGTTVRIVNVVAVLNTGANYVLYYTCLDTPCIQATNEILDVTYRIQFNYQTDNSSTLPVSPVYARSYVDFAARGYQRRTHSAFLLNTTRMPLADKMLMAVPTNWQSAALTGTYINVRTLPIKVRYTGTYTVNDHVGKVFATAYFGQTTGSNANEHFYQGSALLAAVPIVTDGSPYKPVQPIHNHNANAIEPFLDVDYLASSQGTLIVDGSNWTNPDYDKFYRVEYTKSGAVGTSQYFFRKRLLTGGFDYVSSTPSYRPFPSPLVHMHAQTSSSSWTRPLQHGYTLNHPKLRITTNNTNSGQKYSGLNGRTTFEEYDSTRIILWGGDASSSNYFVIYNLATNDWKWFDPDETTPTPLANVGQVAVDNNYNVWVADRSNGLFKITNPLGAHVVKRFSNSVDGIPLGPGGNNYPPCYGIAEGYNGRMWAMFDGGLSYTDDNGVNWTNLNPTSAPAFNFPEITTANWSKVSYIRVDRDAPQHAVGILYDANESNIRRICWYTPSTGTATKHTATAISIDPKDYQKFRCSYHGGMWAAINTSQRLIRVLFGSATSSASIDLVTANMDSTSAVNMQVAFAYDYYKVPYTFGYNYLDTTGVRTVCRGDGKRITPLSGLTTGSYNSYVAPIFNGFERNAPGLIRYHRYNVWGTDPPSALMSGMMPYSTYLGVRANEGDALNARYSPLEEITWTKYHWNGSSWQANYFAPAIDTAGHASGPYGGQRHNFDTESHTFTGRSLIDTSAPFASGLFSNTLTLAMTVIPTAKNNPGNYDTYSKQEYHQTLASFGDTPQQKQLQIRWADESVTHKVEVLYTTSSGIQQVFVVNTPAYDQQYRVVVTVSGTTLTMYINGVQYTPITLTSLFNFQDVKCYLGARVFTADYTYSTPWPSQFFCGSMTNAQIWNKAWDTTDVANDFANPTGVISDPSNNLIARYQLTQSLEGLETKPTHVSVDSLDEGLTIAFANGTSGTSFVATDYHTFGVVDGILKDNAIAFSHRIDKYIVPVDVSFNDFYSPAGTTTVPATSSNVTNYVSWNIVTNGRAKNGEFTGSGNSITASGNRGAYGLEPITGDGYIEFSVASRIVHLAIGLTTTPAGVANRSNINYNLFFNNADVAITPSYVQVYEGDTLRQSNASTYDRGSRFRIQRTGTTVYFYRVNPDTSLTLLYTSGTASIGTLYPMVASGTSYHDTSNERLSVFQCIVNYTMPAYMMYVGRQSTQTGKFNYNFICVDSDTTSTIKLKANGADLSPVVSNTWFGNMTLPGPGQVTVNDCGYLLFNAADAGKTITGDVIVTYTRW